jgi:Ca2+-binding RTX toxin-like protein
MKLSVPARLIAYSLLALVLISAVTAVAAANTVPFTRVTNRSEYIGLNDFKPYACGGMYLTNIVSGSGTLTGTAGNDLILGSPSVDMIDGLGGNDCIVGGGGTDVCLNDVGNDVLISCEVEQ